MSILDPELIQANFLLSLNGANSMPSRVLRQTQALGFASVALILIGIGSLQPLQAIEKDVTVVAVYPGEQTEGDLSRNPQSTAPGCHFLVLPKCFLWGYESRDTIEQGTRAPSWIRQQLTQSFAQGRRPRDDASLNRWLENMQAHHFTREEMSLALDMSLDEVETSIRRLKISTPAPPALQDSKVVRVLPYPGGRHPRLGFLDGAVLPQRETKVSIFPPWADGGYLVADIPEAVFSNLGLIYLAHTHIPTLWDQQQIALPQLEWTRTEEGGLHVKRELPNGVSFSSSVMPRTDHIDMELTLTNGTSERLTGLRVQNCVMLGYAKGFENQDNETKRFREPFAVAGNGNLDRWVITAWTPIQRCWGNPPCPCLHADPQFPDCEPGETVRVRGWLSFYEGTDIDSELKRISSSFETTIGDER